MPNAVHKNDLGVIRMENLFYNIFLAQVVLRVSYCDHSLSVSVRLHDVCQFTPFMFTL